MGKITLIIFTLLSLQLQAQWWEPQNSGTFATLNDVYCITANTVVVVGNAGTILKTTDGGENWVPKPSGTTTYLTKVAFPSATTGYAIGGGATLLKTTDGGETWSAGTVAATMALRDMSCVSETIIYMATFEGIQKSSDGGASFQVVDAGLPAYRIQFLSEQVGYASYYDHLYKTIDGGVNWSIIKDGAVHSFYFTTETKGFAYVGEGIFKTTDGGASFTQIGSSDHTPMSLFALSEDLVWESNALMLLCGCPPSYCITKRSVTGTDASQSVNNCNLSGYPDFAINAIHFADATHGYAVGQTGSPFGYSGAIYKNATGNMEELSVAEAVKNTVRVYPNPASGVVNIAFEGNSGAPFTLEMTDASGKKVHSQTYQATGDVKLDTAAFSKGLYFLTVTSGDDRQTQKLVLN